MNAKIYCKTTEKGIHSFYLKLRNDTYFLFSQSYRKGVQDFYQNGVMLSDSFNHAKSRHDNAIERTMTKIPMYIKYIEKEYGIEVLKQIINKGKKYLQYKSAAYTY